MESKPFAGDEELRRRKEIPAPLQSAGKKIVCEFLYAGCSGWSCRDVGHFLTFCGTVQEFARRLFLSEMQIIKNQLALEQLNSLGWINALGAYARAFTGIVAAEGSMSVPSYFIPCSPAPITRVRIVSICLRQGLRAQVFRICCQSGAPSHTASTLDAVSKLEIVLQLLGRLVVFARSVIELLRLLPMDIRMNRAMFFEHRHQIRHKILDDVEIR